MYNMFIFSDVAFHSIAYGGSNQKPSVATVGGQTSFKDKAPAFTFAESPKPQKLTTGIPDLDRIIGFVTTIVHNLKKVLGMQTTWEWRFEISFWNLAGLTLESNTYTDALNYPFRVEAIRSTIGITNDPCEHGLMLPLEVAKHIFLDKKSINMNLIAPIRDLKVKDPQTTKGVIGFNSENVVTLNEASAKPTGTPALHKSLTYLDLCTDYTIGVSKFFIIMKLFRKN